MPNTIKIAVIGGGKWGKNHIRTLQELNALGGIIDSNRGLHSELKKKFTNTIVQSKIDQNFIDKIDGFVVATPPNTHLEIAKHIISIGKPLLVEKPLVLSMSDAKNLKSHLESNNGKLMVGHLLLFHPAIMKMKSLLDKGILGDLQYIYSNRLNLGRVRKNENVFWSFAPHDISIFQFMLDEFPADISSQGGAFLQQNIYDTSMTYFKYLSGVHGHIFVNWLHPFKEYRLVLIGSRGSLHFEDSGYGKPIKFFKKKNSDPPLDLTQKPEEIIEYERELPLTNELKYFLNCVQGAPIEKANIESGIEVIKILEMATNSIDKDSSPIPTLLVE